MEQEKILHLSNETVLVPTVLLSRREVENLEQLKIKKTYTSTLRCSVYHIPDKELKSVLLSDTGSTNRALALRIVSKALALKGGSADRKMSMLAVAAGLASFSPMEADRVCRNV